MLLPLLFADPGFTVLNAPAAVKVPPLGLLEALLAPVREKAWACDDAL